MRTESIVRIDRVTTHRDTVQYWVLHGDGSAAEIFLTGDWSRVHPLGFGPAG